MDCTIRRLTNSNNQLAIGSKSHEQGATTLADYDWVYDSNGRLTSSTSGDGTDTYTYDNNGQLTGVDSNYQTDETYTYDANGNRTNAGYTTGTNNRLLSDGTYSYDYDDEGNRTKKTNILTGAYVVYEWDHRNRLTKVTFKTNSHVKTKEITYKYDAFDRRIAKDLDANGDGTFESGERYVYDGSDVALVYDHNGNLLDRLLHGPSVDQPLASEDASGEVRWMLADHQGTIRDVAEYDAVADATAVVNHIKYGAFGNITAQSNSSEEPRHTYTGREWDADAELFYYRARWYDPKVGRFISEDPIGFLAGDTNLSRYVSNSPTNFTDPSGLEQGGHHWIPQSIWPQFEPFWTNDAANVLKNATIDPILYDHRNDQWLGVKHHEYTKAVEELMQEYISSINMPNGMTQAQAEQFLGWIAGTADSEWIRAQEHLAAKMHVISTWRNGLASSILVAEGMQEIADDLGQTLTQNQRGFFARVIVNGDTDNGRSALSRLYNDLGKDVVDKMLAAYRATQRVVLSRAAARCIPILAVGLSCLDARAGAMGQGHNPDLTGVTGALDNTVYNAMFGPIVEQGWVGSMEWIGDSMNLEERMDNSVLDGYGGGGLSDDASRWIMENALGSTDPPQ